MFENRNSDTGHKKRFAWGAAADSSGQDCRATPHVIPGTAGEYRGGSGNLLYRLSLLAANSGNAFGPNGLLVDAVVPQLTGCVDKCSQRQYHLGGDAAFLP